MEKKYEKNSFWLLTCQHLSLGPLALTHTQVCHKKFCQTAEKKRGRKEKNVTFPGHSDSHRKPVRQNHITLTCWSVPQFITLFQCKLHQFCTIIKVEINKKKVDLQMNNTDKCSYTEISPVTSSFKGKVTSFYIEYDVNVITSNKNNTLQFYGSPTVLLRFSWFCIWAWSLLW